MAEVIKDYEFVNQGARMRMPVEWFDGRLWLLTASDLGCEEEEGAFAKKKQALLMAAYRRGKKLHINVDADNYDHIVIVIQAYENEASLEPKRKRQAKKPKKA